MPVRRSGAWRKRWRYVGAFAEEMLLCAASVEIGPIGQTFWALWDRRARTLKERTRPRLPGRQGEVWAERPRTSGPLGLASDGGSVVRIEARHPDVGRVSARLSVEAGRWTEAICPAGDHRYVWTRKRVDVPVEVELTIDGEPRRFEARGVEDESAGYHPRHTVWSWSAGVGRSLDGRSVGWNLVSGVNDPPERSERAIWIDGEPFEPGPVTFEDLDAIGFDDGARLRFTAESERRRSENLIVVRYSYRQPFGRFSGSLAGELVLDSGLGVMEHHDALW